MDLNQAINIFEAEYKHWEDNFNYKSKFFLSGKARNICELVVTALHETLTEEEISDFIYGIFSLPYINKSEAKRYIEKNVEPVMKRFMEKYNNEIVPYLIEHNLHYSIREKEEVEIAGVVMTVTSDLLPILKKYGKLNRIAEKKNEKRKHEGFDLAVIALIYLYLEKSGKGKGIQNEKHGNEVAREFGKNSGKRLCALYKEYRDFINIREIGNSIRRESKKIRNLKTVMDYLKDNGYNEAFGIAKKDYDNLKSEFEDFHGKSL